MRRNGWISGLLSTAFLIAATPSWATTVLLSCESGLCVADGGPSAASFAWTGSGTPPEPLFPWYCGADACAYYCQGAPFTIGVYAFDASNQLIGFASMEICTSGGGGVPE